MAAITAAKFYLGKTAQASGNWYCNIRSARLITTNLGTGTILGTSDAVNYTAIPDNASPGWVTFTFSTPVTISSSGWYGVQIYNDTSDYASANVYVYYASDFSDPAEERGWICDRLGGDAGWDSGGYSFAYDVTITDADDVGATTPTGTSQRSGGAGSTKGLGVRTYITADTHAKATNPTPANAATEVDWSIPALSWSGTGDTYTVRVSRFSSFINADIVVENTAVTTYTLTAAQQEERFDLSDKLYWRVDSTKDGSTLTGDTWNFDPRPGKSTVPVPFDGTVDVGVFPTLAWILPATADTVCGHIQRDWTLEVIELFCDEPLKASYADWSDYLEHGRTYSWQIDTANDYGETEGDVWTFKTYFFAPILASWSNYPGKTLGPTGSYVGGEAVGPGVLGVDYYWTGLNSKRTTGRLVAAAASALWYEEIT